MKRKRGVEDDDDDGHERNKQVDYDQPMLKKRRLTHGVTHDLLFHDVCVCLEYIENTKLHKKDHIRDFLERNRNRDFYPFMRLMLPDLDRERVKFGIKERKLADIYAEIAGMGNVLKGKLKEWKSSGENTSVTKFSRHVYLGLVECGFRENQKAEIRDDAMTVTEINTWLDEFCMLPKKNMVSWKNKIGCIINRLSALEHQYLIRIIMKNMKIGMQGKSILGELHPLAQRLYDREPNLKNLCVRVKDGTNLSLDDHVIQPFTPLKPMLAKKGHPNHLEKLLEYQGDIYYEPKFDGERVLIHFSNVPATGGNGSSRIDYYTRNGNNYNHVYDIFNDVVEKTLKNRFQNCILDGEMLVYDERLDCLKEFGTNRQHSLDRPEDEHFCYQCFDVLYIDGREVTNEKYTMRKRLLKNKIIPKKKYFEVVQEEKITGGADEINQRLREAVAEGNEGIMLKKSDSKYEFDRRGSWTKYKPYYLQSINLLIIGCFYGTKFKRKSPSDFLCGIRQSPERRYDEKKVIDLEGKEDEDERKLMKFFTFTKVGTGFNMRELDTIQQSMKDVWVPYNPARPPSWLVGLPPPSGSEKYTPQYVISDPSQAIVLEVKCDAVVETNKYGMKYTLRHGRAKKLRLDLGWEDICDQDMFETFRYNIENKKKFGDFDGDDDLYEDEFYTDEFGVAKRRRKRKNKRRKTGRRNFEPTVPRSFQRGVDPGDVEVEVDVFKGRNFVILTFEKYDPRFPKGRDDLERMILALGGRVHMNLRPGSTHAAIASHVDTKVKNIRDNTKCVDVIRPGWLAEVFKKKRYVPLRYHHLIFATDQTKEDISKRVDKYGDVYTQDLTVDDFLRFRDKIIDRSPDEEILPPPPPPSSQQPNDRMVDEDQGRNNNNFTLPPPQQQPMKKEEGSDRFVKKKPRKGIVDIVKKRIRSKFKNPISFFENERFFLDQYHVIGDPSTKKRFEENSFGAVELLIKLYSGKLLTHPRNKLMDFIVIESKENLSNLENIKGMMLPIEDRHECTVVTMDWILMCAKMGRKVEPGPYLVDIV